MNLENMILSERSSRQSPCVAIPSMRNAQSRQESGRKVGYEGQTESDGPRGQSPLGSGRRSGISGGSCRVCDHTRNH